MGGFNQKNKNKVPKGGNYGKIKDNLEYGGKAVLIGMDVVTCAMGIVDKISEHRQRKLELDAQIKNNEQELLDRINQRELETKRMVKEFEHKEKELALQEQRILNERENNENSHQERMLMMQGKHEREMEILKMVRSTLDILLMDYLEFRRLHPDLFDYAVLQSLVQLVTANNFAPTYPAAEQYPMMEVEKYPMI